MYICVCVCACVCVKNDAAINPQAGWRQDPSVVQFSGSQPHSERDICCTLSPPVMSSRRCCEVLCPFRCELDLEFRYNPVPTLCVCVALLSSCHTSVTESEYSAAVP